MSLNAVKKTLISSVVTNLFFFQITFANYECEVHLESFKTTERISNNDFTTDRDFWRYQKNFFDLAMILEILSDRGGTWLDLGSGEGVAISSYYSDYAPWDTKLKAFGITYTINPNFISNFIKPDQATFMIGRFFEDIPQTEIPRTNVITDFYGVLSYTLKFDLALYKALKSLKTKGVLYIHNGPNDESRLLTSFYNGPILLNLVEFLKLIPGIKVEAIETKFNPTGNLNIKITKLRDIKAFEIPKLQLIRITDDSPPVRVFRITKD